MDKLKRHITQPISIAPLAMFRVLFGGIMLLSIIRFAARGWIYELYIDPVYFFSYYGFEWVKPLGEIGTLVIFGLMALSALGIMLGSFYRVATVLFFLTFTYVELIDKSNYLNHYYFVSLISFLLIWLPANRYFSLDVWRKPSLLCQQVPAWQINILKFQLGLVYVYAGIAKLNPYWLFEAMPLKMWLPAHADFPLIGWLFTYEWTAFAFSWGGAIYDLFIVFFLSMASTRIWAYMAVLGFHLMTAALFQIGMFPYIMILATLIFFSANFHESIIRKTQSLFSYIKGQPDRHAERSRSIIIETRSLPNVPFDFAQGDKLKPKFGHNLSSKIVLGMLLIFMLIQIILPWRYLLYPGNLFWNEEGYRFSWRVMLMEKAGYTTFNIKDSKTGREGEANLCQYLTANQQKMMATQPDMILQFAHFLDQEYRKQGIEDPEIRVDAYATLNGRGSRLFIDPSIDLSLQKESFAHKKWVLPWETPQKSPITSFEPSL